MLRQHVWSMIMTLYCTDCWIPERGKAVIIREKRTMQQSVSLPLYLMAAWLPWSRQIYTFHNQK